ncbi:Hypothetical predicted protein [Mytilus galloprovincialis]|uniref:Retrotransposon gag domain-containing protein n=1 Tax=Mytilus galloprovincialis TaxID=29158 RepID=A0A8B6BUU2_MYTGA|nr:Hypothetical predicted protein [Mytilus galloprovincialis]
MSSRYEFSDPPSYERAASPKVTIVTESMSKEWKPRIMKEIKVHGDEGNFMSVKEPIKQVSFSDEERPFVTERVKENFSSSKNEISTQTSISPEQHTNPQKSIEDAFVRKENMYSSTPYDYQMASNYPKVQTKIAQPIVTSSTCSTPSVFDKMPSDTCGINVPQAMPSVIQKNDQREISSALSNLDLFESSNNQIHSSAVGLKPSEPQSRHDLYPNVQGTFPYMPTYDPQIVPSNFSERRGITQESFPGVMQYDQTYRRNDTVLPGQNVYPTQLPPAGGGSFRSPDMGVPYPYYPHVPISSANAPVSSVNMGPAFINQNQSNLNPYTLNIMNMPMVNNLPRQTQPMNLMQPQRPMGNIGPNINPQVYGVHQNMMAPQFYPNMMGPMQNNPPRVSRKQKEPPTFDGQNSDWVDYIIQFGKVATWNGWDPYESAQQLVMSLRGVAQRMVSELNPYQLNDFTFLKHMLSQRFNPLERETAHKYEFKNRKKRKDESVSDFGHALRRLASQAFPERDAISIEGSVIEQFIEGIGNSHFQSYIRLFSKPRTLEQAISFAIEYEAVKGPLDQIKKPYFSDEVTYHTYAIDKEDSKLQYEQNLNLKEQIKKTVKEELGIKENQNSPRKEQSNNKYRSGNKNFKKELKLNVNIVARLAISALGVLDKKMTK